MIINKKLRYISFSIFCFILIGLQINSATWFRLRLADYYVKTQNYNQAITLYKKILRKETLDIKPRTSNLKDITNIYQGLINLLFIENRFFEIAQALERMTEINPTYKISPFSNLSGPEHYRKFGLCLLRVNLKDIAIKQFQKAAELQPDNPLAYYQLALIYQKQEMEEKAITQFEKIIELTDKLINRSIDKLPDYLADVYYNLAIKFEREGDIEKAKDHYEKAISLDRARIIGAYYRLKSLYKKEGKFDEADNIETIFLNLKPKYEVNHKFSDDLILLGYSLNEKEFELFNKGKITFFWRVSSQNSELSYEAKKLQGIYRVGDRLYEIREVENLAPNFGFEVDSIGVGFPYGWDTDVYVNKSYYTRAEDRRIIFEEKPLGKTQCLLLTNTLSRGSSCQSDCILIDKDNFYLQVGWIKSIDGGAYLGRIWLDSEKISIYHSFAVAYVSLPTWKYYSQVIVPLANSAYCRLWLINWNSKGKAYFDDIIFIKLELPVEA